MREIADVLYKYYKNGIENYRRIEYKHFLKRRKSRLKAKKFSIITSNCNGAFMYYDLGLPYLSPTVNLTISMNDFVKMAQNLKWYMHQEIVKLDEDCGYPAGLLGDVKINFVHYRSFEEGVQKWEERKRRINWDNIFLVGTARGDCSYETIREFDQLPYKNKVIFTKDRYPEFQSAYYIKGFEKEKELGVLVKYKKKFLKRRYLDDFDYVAFLNKSYLKDE